MAMQMGPPVLIRGRRLPPAGCRILLGVALFGTAWPPAAPESRASDAVQAHPRVVILADPGRFLTVDSAARAEREVRWGRGDSRGEAACTESYAATELRDLLGLALPEPAPGIAVSGDSVRPAVPEVIVLTSNRSDPRLRGLELPGTPELSRSNGQGFRIVSVRSPDGVVHVIEGAGPVGVLYGAYALLDRLGVRFYRPGSAEVMAAAVRRPLPAVFSVSERPAFRVRGFWAWEPRGDRDFFVWMARNRLNLWTAADTQAALLHKLGIRLTCGGHEIQSRFLNPAAPYPYAGAAARRAGTPDPCPPSAESRGDANHDGVLSYFETHPEWYGMRAGRRSADIHGDRGDNFCTSNPYASQELIRNLLRALTTGQWRDADVLMFWMLDNGAWCECTRCVALGSPTDRLFALLKDVQAGIREAQGQGRLRRDVSLWSLAFLETMPPPTRALPRGFDLRDFSMTYFPIERCIVHPLGDSSCLEVNVLQAEELSWWTDPTGFYRGPLAIGEYYNLGEMANLPVPLSRIMAADIPMYFKRGARDFMYMHVPTHSWGTFALNHAVYARLLWNPGVRVDAIRREYLQRSYPGTWREMEKHHDALESVMGTFKLLRHRVRFGTYLFSPVMAMRLRLDPFSLRHFGYVPPGPPQPGAPGMEALVGGIAGARAHLDRALQASVSPAERARLGEEDQQLTYAEQSAAFYEAMLKLYVADLRGDAAAALAHWHALHRAARRLKGMREVLRYTSTDPDVKNALDATRAVDLYARWGRKFPVPPPGKR